MPDDVITRLIDQWRKVRPDLDPLPMRTSGRLLRVAKLVHARTEAQLKQFGLGLWQFDVLATLRRHDHDLSPGQLLNLVMLTSGAMTHRLDKLESEGFIERRPDPEDRRGVLIHLTPAGRKLVDQAVKVRFDEARLIESILEPAEAEALSRLLLKLEEGITHRPRAGRA